MKRQSVTEHDKLYGFMKLAMNLSIVMVVVIVASTVFVLVQEGFTVNSVFMMVAALGMALHCLSFKIRKKEIRDQAWHS